MFKNNEGKREKWIREEHLLGDETFRCTGCDSVFALPAAYCPKCKAEMCGYKTDPLWMDEMAEWDEE